jgi:hypothetical protein
MNGGIPYGEWDQVLSRVWVYLHHVDDSSDGVHCPSGRMTLLYD